MMPRGVIYGSKAEKIFSAHSASKASRQRPANHLFPDRIGRDRFLDNIVDRVTIYSFCSPAPTR
jgi:hypothetical protein